MELDDKVRTLVLASAAIRSLECQIPNDVIMPANYRRDALGIVEQAAGLTVFKDGDHACAMLGPNLAEGIAEFAKIHNPSHAGQEEAEARAVVKLAAALLAGVYADIPAIVGG